MAARWLVAATINVPGDKSSIQGAIASASNGDIIVVAAGTYYEDIDFLGKSITLTSASGASSTTIYGSGTMSVIAFNSGGTGATVNGFTIQNGNAAFQNTYEGGGISIEAGSPTITNNIVRNNHSCAGAGIAVASGSPVIQNNVISNNTPSGCSGGIGGGGISVRGGSPQILGNMILNNSSSQLGGGISLFAAGSPLIRNNVISGNVNPGISTANASAALIVQNLIINNTGGGLVPAQGTIVNNTIAGNGSAAINGVSSGASIVNNLIVGNSTTAALACGSAGAVSAFQNNDIYNGGASSIGMGCNDPTGSNGNISADPLFISPSSGNYRLLPGSPAIDAGLNSAPGLTTTDLDGLPRIVAGKGTVAVIDMGAYEYPGPATIFVSATNLAFGSQPVLTTSTSQSITLNNTGKVAGYVGFTIAGDFAYTTTCGTGIPPGTSCSVAVSFDPSVQGTRSGTLNIVSNTSPALPAIALTGMGIDPVPTLSSISPSAAVSGSPGFTLTLVGTNFVSNSVVLWNGSGLVPTAISGTQISVSVPASDVAAAGTATVTVSNPSPGGGTSGPLSFVVSNPQITVGGVVNGASYTTPVAPGSFVTLFGNNLAAGTTQLKTLPLPTTAGGVSISLSGYGAPLFYVSPAQIDFQMPWELAGQSQVTVTVMTNGVASNSLTLPLAGVAPGLLSTNSQGTGQGAIVIAGTSAVANMSRPANRTDIISIYATGLGTVTNPPASGNINPLTVLSQTISTPVVTIGGIQGTVLFSGLAPGLVGLNQVNVQMPLNAPTGNAIPVVLTINNVPSNTVTIAVQ